MGGLCCDPFLRMEPPLGLAQATNQIPRAPPFSTSAPRVWGRGPALVSKQWPGLILGDPTQHVKEFVHHSPSAPPPVPLSHFRVISRVPVVLVCSRPESFLGTLDFVLPSGKPRASQDELPGHPSIPFLPALRLASHLLRGRLSWPGDFGRDPQGLSATVDSSEM